MVIRIFKKGQIRVNITVVEKGQFWVVITVVKKGQVRVVISVVKKGKFTTWPVMAISHTHFFLQAICDSTPIKSTFAMTSM